MTGQQQQRNMQKPSLEIFDLPDEIIQLIISFIPEEYLETYINVPFIGAYIANNLYHSVEIIYSYKKYKSQISHIPPKWYKYGKNMYGEPKPKEVDEFTVKGAKTHEPVDPNKQYNDFGDGVYSFKVLTVNPFVQLCKHSRYRPKIVHFSRFDLFVWFHERYPHILTNLSRIDISFSRHDKLPPLTFDKPYNIYLVSNFPVASASSEVSADPKGFVYEEMLTTISSLRMATLPNLNNFGWCENLQELGLVDASLLQLPRLFPNLKKLCLFEHISLKEAPLTDAPPVTSLPRFPSGLEFLRIGVWAFDKLDISYLDKLREFVIDTRLGVDRFDRFVFPLGIERIAIIGDTMMYEGDTNLDNLDGIELYPNLKELRVVHPWFTKTNIFSKTRCFPAGLQCLEMSLFDLLSQYHRFPVPEPLLTVGKSFPIPSNIKVLVLDTYDGLYRANELSFPLSLKTLSITSDAKCELWPEREDWSGAVFPTSLEELNLDVTRIEGVSFPKSLRSLTLRAQDPIKDLNLLKLKHLVRLKIGWVGMDRFMSRVPSNLKVLDLSDNGINQVFIRGANLKVVELAHENGFVRLCSDNFQLPDCVEVLTLSLDRSLSTIEEDIFPILLRELYLKKSFITSELLDQFQFRCYTSLVKLDLLGNEICFLENNLPSSLQWLCLDGNPISAFASSTVFSSLKNLQKLSMASTKINDYFQTDENLLKFPSSLTSLDLSDNKLQPGVSPRLVFLTHSRLQEVCLNGNPDMTDVQIIVEVLRASSPDMVELSLDRLLQKHIREEVNFLLF